MKIALSLITRGTGKDAERLEQCLSSIASYIDGIFLTFTEKPEQRALDTANKYKANISQKEFAVVVDEKMVKWLKEFFGYEPHMKVGTKMFPFDEARNYNLSLIPKEYDWIFWMDTDDVLRRGENLRKVAEDLLKKGFEAVYFNYLYQVELDKSEACVHCGAKLDPNRKDVKHVIISHIRERLIRNQGKFKWIAPIHETLIEQTPTQKTDNYDLEVMHLATEEDRASSLTRNLPNLELAIYQSEGKDPRHLYYLAKAYFDIRTAETDKKAIPLIMAYLYGVHKSGWPQERSQASEYLAELYRRNGELNNAIKACMNAMIEFPQNPAIFLSLAQSYLVKQDYETALFWCKLAATIPEPNTTLVKNPRDIQGQILEILYNCAINMGKIDEAWAAASKTKQLMPDNPQAVQIFEWISHTREQRDVSKTILTLADYLKKTGEYYKLKPLLAATPRISEDVPAIIDLKKKNNPPKQWQDNEIAIWCGMQFTQWTPKSMDDPQEAFIGGSEEAIIRIAQELTKLNWKITVYADPGIDHEGEYDGVKYIPYYKFNSLDNFNILIAWRQPKFFSQDIKAKKKYVWCHDILNKLDFDEITIKSFDKVFVLSDWHRQNIDNVPNEKIFITSNGI